MGTLLVDQETLRGELGEYRIYELIAAGGFASVYYGRDTATNVPVAVKRLHPHLQAETSIVERFEQEANTVRGLDHPHIVRLLDQGRDQHQVPFIVMEWVEGLTVADWLKRRGRYLSAAAAKVGCQVLKGLDAAWARRVVHRDIKPANLMVSPSGRLKIMDFGVAKDVELATMAGSSGLIGTPAYMAPEQLRGQSLDCRADLYSLGVTLYMMLAGRPPFEGPSFADYFRQHLEQEPPPMEDLSADVDQGLAEVLRKALAKNPDDRFATPAEMLAALEPYADGATSVSIRSASTESTVVSPRGPGIQDVPASTAGPRWISPTAGVVLVLVAALVAGGFLFASQQNTGTSPAAAVIPSVTAASLASAPTVPPLAVPTPVVAPPIIPAATPNATVAATQIPSAATWRIVGADSALFNELVGIAFDPQGNLYVSNNGSHSIDKLDSSGYLTARWGGADNRQPQFHNPGGIATDDNGAVYIADTGNDRILHLSGAGIVLGQVGGHGQARGQFDRPTSVAVDGGDNLYVTDSANHRVQKLAPDGKVLAVWGSFGTGPANFNFPSGIDLDQQGNLYVADRNNNRVVKLSAEGSPLAMWDTASNTDSPLTNPSSVAVDSSGNVFVAGWATDRVQRIRKLSSTGGLLTSWTIDGKNEAQLSLPYQLDLDANGNLHVAVIGADRVDEFSPDGTSIRALGTTRNAPGVFRRPNNIAIDSHDDVYVTDWGNERIQRLAASSGQDQTQGSAQWGGLNDLQGVAVDREGNLFVTESTDCRVRKLSPVGDTLGLLGSCGPARGQFQDPQAIAVDADGNAYVADRLNNRIVKLSPSLEVVQTFGTHGSVDGQLDQPNGVALDSQGNIFVADRNNNRIQKLSTTGQVLAIFGDQNNPALELSNPQGVSVDAQGNVYIADWGSSRIIKLSPRGELLAQLGGPGTGLGEFYAPEGLAVDSHGRVYVADTGNNRVQEFAADTGL
ncbi:MAG: SMP-30/gluconolactonase/LRE family protein [Chloroflexi bacterium]|nr:SMP-30/gluconolactonase/LRE family protein [Chloroflexota bacterium]